MANDTKFIRLTMLFFFRLTIVRRKEQQLSDESNNCQTNKSMYDELNHRILPIKS